MLGRAQLEVMNTSVKIRGKSTLIQFHLEKSFLLSFIVNVLKGKKTLKLFIPVRSHDYMVGIILIFPQTR